MKITPLFSRGKSLPPAGRINNEVPRKYYSQAIFDFLARHYGVIIVLLGGTIIILLAIDHIDTHNHITHFHTFFFQDISIVVLLMGIIWFLTRNLLNSLADRSQMINILRLKNEIGSNLSASLDLQDVSKRLSQQLVPLLSSVDIKLYVYDKNKNKFIESATENTEDPPQIEASHELDSYPCRYCLTNNHNALQPLHVCQQGDHFIQSNRHAGLCLPLTDGIWPVGLLHLYLPSENTLVAEQVQLLENLSPEISHAIGTVIEKKEREGTLLTQKVRTMQLDIARDLHDTVGQNISYLRMKLDYLSETKSRSQTELEAEIKTMSKVANESYDLVRGTLAILQSETSADLFNLFTRYAEQLAERSTFKLDFASAGKSQPISANRMRQLFYVFREALNNVEKHANASQISMTMTWDEKFLTLIIFDNGCGFDYANLQYTGHYGLKFMRDRVDLLNGSLSIHSAAGAGTEVIIHVPYE